MANATENRDISSRIDLQELNNSFNTVCLANLNIILQKYKSHPKFDSENILYNIFKDLYNGLEKHETIMKYIFAHSKIDDLVRELHDDAYLESEDEKYSSYQYLGLIDDISPIMNRLSKNSSIPHDKERVRKAKNNDEFDELNAGFSVYCMIYNVISVDNLVAIQGLDFYEKRLPINKFDNTTLIDISEATYQWFSDVSKNIKLEDADEIKAWYLTKYICLSSYYGNIAIINQ